MPEPKETSVQTSEQTALISDIESWFSNLSPEEQQKVFVQLCLGFLAANQIIAAKEELNEQLSQAREKLHYEATHDPLTTALNRRGLEEYLLSNEEAKAVAIISADADNFKAINDNFGYDRGDQVIVATYNVLSASVRRQDIIVRLGGDEFLIILNGLETEDEEVPTDQERRQRIPTNDELLEITTARITKKIEDLLAQEHNSDLREVGFGLSVGGLVRTAGSPFSIMVKEAENKMKGQKHEHHEERGQYR